MTEHPRTRTTEQNAPRRRLLPWLILAALLVGLMVFIALRGATETIDQDGSSNSDLPPAAQTTGGTNNPG